MLKALLWKEFRELLPITATALAAQFLFIAYSISEWQLGRWGHTAWPFLFFVALLLPIGIGLWQGSRESSHNTYQFVLHRPVPRHLFFTAKILFGIAATIVAGMLPIFSYTAYVNIALPQTLRGFDMIEPMVGLFAAVLPLYLGALLSNILSGRWYGRRFLPLLAAIFLYLGIQSSFSMLLSISSKFPGTVSPIWYLLSLGIGPLAACCYVIAILYVGQTRDYS